MELKKADSCKIQKSAFSSLTLFFKLSLTKGPLYNKIATLNNTDDTEKNISVSVSNAKVITHDNSYIYRKATMTVKSDETINKINGIDIPKTSTDQSVFIMNEENNIISFDVIQKISKEQSSETIDGAKLLKM